MTNLDEHAVLHQMGYYRDDTIFVSLNLTPEQFQVIEDARMATVDGTLEELIVGALDELRKLRSLVPRTSTRPVSTGQESLRRVP